MDPKTDLREFLISRRAKINPAKAGLPVYGRNRRVSGLRREEAAMLAGISVEYYTRLERGNASGASESVLEGVARALQLDEAERAHLFDLARNANSAPPARRPTQERVRPTVQRVLDAMTDTPAYVRNERLDILAANRLGHALYSEMFTDPVEPANIARYLFLNPRSTEYFSDWEGAANDVVAILRAAAGRDPYDRRLSDLIGELSTRSDEFRVRWAAHNVKSHRTGTKRLHHPLVGDLTLAYEVFELAAGSGLTMLVYSAEPGSPSHEAIGLLASWTATPVDVALNPMPEES